MTKVPDRTKMRREYLWKKEIAYFRLVLTIGMFILCCISVRYVVLRLSHQGTIPKVVLGVTLLGVSSLLLVKALSRAKSELVFAVSIPYVPPIHDQIAALPAEEVLLRGSQASPAPQEELLRPAGKVETRAEELLRSASVGE